MESSKIYPGTLKFSLIILALCLSLFLTRLVSITAIPSAGSVLWSRNLDSIDSIGQFLSITVGRNTPAEGIPIDAK